MEEFVSIESEEIGKKWFIKKRKCYSNNLNVFYRLLFKIAKNKNLLLESIGKVYGNDIYFLFPKKIVKNNPSAIIIAGMHGDEPAGPWALADWLESLSKTLFDKINLFILPLINPSGFKLGNLKNIEGKNPNGGFIWGLEHNDLSKEGKLIIKKIDFDWMAKNGFLSLHEDYGPKDFYLYLWEKSGKIGEFSKTMSNSSRMIFKKFNGKTDGFESKDGIIFGVDESLGESIDSIEYYSLKKGVPFVACAETPRNYEIEKRIFVHKKVIQNFVDFIIKNGRVN
jgi:hypothetical protein